jgi:hypothetical protein
MKKYNLITLLELGDQRDSLIELEAYKNIPFEIKRVYFIFNTKLGVSRGFHAHRKLQQVAICVKGKCRIELDDGVQRQDVWLDTPNKGLVIGSWIWREMHDFSPDCVLLVLASEVYNFDDYVRSYDEFTRLSASNNSLNR